MLAFLKRRWILLLCAYVLFVCSMVDFVIHFGGAAYGGYGLKDGNLFLKRSEVVEVNMNIPGLEFELHGPKLGEIPFYRTEITPFARRVGVVIPLWLPLAVVLGWLVFRELRWREKRAKAADANPAQP
jgi:hypothetical protein